MDEASQEAELVKSLCCFLFRVRSPCCSRCDLGQAGWSSSHSLLSAELRATLGAAPSKCPAAQAPGGSTQMNRDTGSHGLAPTRSHRKGDMCPASPCQPLWLRLRSSSRHQCGLRGLPLRASLDLPGSEPGAGGRRTVLPARRGRRCGEERLMLLLGSLSPPFLPLLFLFPSAGCCST